MESYRDKQGKVRHRGLEWPGTCKTAAPEPIPLEGLGFADVAAKLMEQTLTADDVFELMERIGKRTITVGALAGVGVRFDFVQKTVAVPVAQRIRMEGGPPARLIEPCDHDTLPRALPYGASGAT